LALTTPEQDRQLAALRHRVAEAEAKLARVGPTQRNIFAQWLRSKPADLAIGGLVADYPLEQPTDGRIVNRADASKPGAMHDNPQFVPGRVGHAVQLTGDNHVRFPGVAAFRRYDPFSFALWLKPAEAYERAVVFHRSRAWHASGSQGYQLLIEEGKLTWAIVHFWPGNAIAIRTRDTVKPDDWQ